MCGRVVGTYNRWGIFFKKGMNKLKFCKNLKYQKKITVCIRWRRVGSRRDKSRSGTYKTGNYLAKS